jgi:hypothetical protein
VSAARSNPPAAAPVAPVAPPAAASRGRRGPRRRAGLGASLIAALVALLGCGCQRVLFASDAPRTQFEQYDRMHNRYAVPEEFDLFGRPRPALRARLSNAR